MNRSKNPTILILEDNSTELTTYFQALRSAGYSVHAAQHVDDAWNILENSPINMILSDVHLSRDMNLCEGLVFLSEVKEKQPHITLMAMSSDPTLNLATRAKKAGAWTFIRKPDVIGEEFLVQIRQGLDIGTRLGADRIKRSNKKASILKKYPEGIILTPDLRARIQLSVTNPDAAVIIEGETGTGKEEIVKLIHQRMKQDHEMPLVSLNCAQLKGDLVLSTLFGHKKGAFTGAVDASIGAVGQANGGVLFLDEFHRLSHEVQEMLLRTLQDGTYFRVGDNKEMRSFFRLIIAAPRNLEDCAIDGSILMDLRFRLYGIDIRVPPLRERLDQIADFIDLFFANYDKPYTLADNEREKLIQRCSELYWQGNIRQLFGVLNIMSLNAQLGDGNIKSTDLPVHKTMLPPQTVQEKTDDDVGTMVQNYIENPGPYDVLIDSFEKNVFTRLLLRYPNIKTLCQAIGLARSTFDGKRRRLGMLSNEAVQE